MVKCHYILFVIFKFVIKQTFINLSIFVLILFQDRLVKVLDFNDEDSVKLTVGITSRFSKIAGFQKTKAEVFHYKLFYTF